MKVPLIGIVAFGLTFTVCSNVSAQGGGASSTGTIQGRVIDAQGAVLPGVAVTATSPSSSARRQRLPRIRATIGSRQCRRGIMP